MIDHTGVLVSDFEKSKQFYTETLKPIGYQLLLEFPASVTGSTNVAVLANLLSRIFGSPRRNQTIRVFTSPFGSENVH
jgi:catechol 2,3-dioxygenase-like lactoylglutathione lyase family enzyme